MLSCAGDAKAATAAIPALNSALADLQKVDVTNSTPSSPGPGRGRRTAHLVDFAQAIRPDLQVAAKKIEAAQSAPAIEKRYLFRDVHAEVSLEGEGGDVQLGPTVVLQVSIFDQNQAQIAKADYRHAQANGVSSRSRSASTSRFEARSSSTRSRSTRRA